jgi:pimeloyl-ACP methyl ester carboxylesterase
VPFADVPGARIHYEVTGEGEPLLLIPCLAADLSCWAFQVPAYAERFRCITVDLPGVGESPTPAGPASTERYADELAALLGTLGIERAHVAGVSLGSAVGVHMAARHPDRVRTLSLHSAWSTTDAFMGVVLEAWRTMARAMPTVADMVVAGVFPWAFTPEMYAERPEVLEEFAAVARSRPPQPLDGFMAQCDAVAGHDAAGALARVAAPTLITYGARDALTSTRFAPALAEGIADARLVVFDHLSHAGFNEDPDAFTAATLSFLTDHRAA